MSWHWKSSGVLLRHQLHHLPARGAPRALRELDDRMTRRCLLEACSRAVLVLASPCLQRCCRDCTKNDSWHHTSVRHPRLLSMIKPGPLMLGCGPAYLPSVAAPLAFASAAAIARALSLCTRKFTASIMFFYIFCIQTPHTCTHRLPSLSALHKASTLACSARP